MVAAGIFVWLLLICFGLEILRSINVNSFFSKETADGKKGELDSPTPVFLSSV